MSHPKKHTKTEHKAIQTRAYYKWLAAGKPNCDGKQFWHEAEQELTRAEVLLEEIIEVEVVMK